jgi:2-aminoadipate transaminase
LRFAGEDVPSALAVPGAKDRVVYAGTFSKPFASGARVGFGVIPPLLLRRLLRVKGNHDFGTSNLLQQYIRRALEVSAYRRHVDVLRRRYAEKARIMTEALRRHWPEGVAWAPPRGGLYVWGKLDPRMRTGPNSAFFRQALKHDVLYVPGVFCYAHDPTRPRPDCELRLSFGGATLTDIEKGISRLGATCRELRERGKSSSTPPKERVTRPTGRPRAYVPA